METLESFFNRSKKQGNTAETTQTITPMVAVRYRLDCSCLFSYNFLFCQTKLRRMLPNLFLFSRNRQKSFRHLVIHADQIALLNQGSTSSEVFLHQAL
jgi:hypothetical protein